MPKDRSSSLRLRRGTVDELIAMKQEILDRHLRKELSGKDAAALLCMHPKSFSRLKKRYREHGPTVLVPQKPGPKQGRGTRPKNRTDDTVEQLVCLLARELKSLGPVPLAEKLRDDHGIRLDATTVWRILKRRKVRYAYDYHRWTEDPPQLYCLEKPGIELQLDGCFPYGRRRKLVCIDAIDDCSRWTYGRLYEGETFVAARDFIDHLLHVAPFTIQAVRVDNRYGRRFREYCVSRGISVIQNDPYEPKQNGKIERFHKTIKQEFFLPHTSFHDDVSSMSYQLSQYLFHYNTQRRHGGLGMHRMTPLQKLAAANLGILADDVLTYPQKVTSIVQQYKC